VFVNHLIVTNAPRKEIKNPKKRPVKAQLKKREILRQLFLRGNLKEQSKTKTK
jgi:hypothetical protein